MADPPWPAEMLDCHERGTVEQLVAHPPWCQRIDCVDTGEHVSAPVAMSTSGDFVGIDATLVALGDTEVTLVRLNLTDDGNKTVVALSLDQAQRLTRALSEVVEAGDHKLS
ncbi:hypothetical protein [Asanoa iriomotensis]|uniref:Uncharacterized protein n=1 Tax=Asanoa iriomotensis TaxID=234613 RepID=A0ABQ4C1H8_9ACTN|nr:hypothetical protein [Asanoa iriomotensis]GIF56641.1 hypothetical protein Air01nite_27360 [Asanoa iriomotensis]